MTGRREYFSDLNVDVRGSIKFGDSSTVEIKGVGSVILVAKTSEHRLLTGVYYIPALKNSMISLGQLDENGSRVEIDSGVLRIWDRRCRLLAKVDRGKNNLYVLYAEVAQLGTKEMVRGKMVDGGSTSTYNDYVHFEGDGGVSSSSSPSVPTPVPGSPPTMASSSPAPASPQPTPVSTPLGAASCPRLPPQPAMPHTLAPTATLPSTASSTPAHDEPRSVEFATPLPHDKDRVDAYHDGEPLRYRTMADILGDQPMPGRVPHDLEAVLHLMCDDGESRSFAEAEGYAAWRTAMQIDAR